MHIIFERNWNVVYVMWAKIHLFICQWIYDIYIIILLLHRTMYRSYSLCTHCDQLRRYFISWSAKRRKQHVDIDISVDKINETIFFFRCPRYTGYSKIRDFNFNVRLFEFNLTKKSRKIFKLKLRKCHFDKIHDKYFLSLQTKLYFLILLCIVLYI